MTSSLRNQASTKLDLYISSRDFLRVFADAASRIPRHRQTRYVTTLQVVTCPYTWSSFFTHLVDVLGPSDFLAPICMLLVQKNASRAIRKNADEALALPLSVLQHYEPSIRISVRTFTYITTRLSLMIVQTLLEILSETQRLLTRLDTDDSSCVALLDDVL
jgi:U3 small nucleolar RNA-associated protein 10